MTQPLALRAEHNGVYYLSAERRPAFEAQAQADQQSIQTIDLARHATLSGALKKIGSTLHFPAWYGANLDALFDCLTDTEWLTESGRIISISGTQRLSAAQPEAFATLLEVLQSAAETLCADRILFRVLLDTPNPALNPLPEA